MLSQSTAKRGVVELRTFDYKTTWSEFQKPSQTAATQCKAKLHVYNLKKTSPLQSRSKAVVSTPRMYLRRVYFLVDREFSILTNRATF